MSRYPKKKGNLELRGSVWSLRIRAIKYGKPKYLRIRVGTLEDIPTKLEAERVAAMLPLTDPSRLVSLRRQRPVTERPSLPRFTAEWFDAKLLEQQYKCAICRCVPRRFVPDHDHETGELRGLLCQQCNSGIGMLRDDVFLVRSALLYLESYGAHCAPSVPKQENTAIV